MSVDRVPYTYLLIHKPTGRRYYGVRYGKGCHPSDLWVTYFSSSKEIRNLPREEFSFEVRKVFLSAKDAYVWEQKVIQRLRLWEREDWFNKAWAHSNGSFNLVVAQQNPSEETRAKIAKAGRGRKHTEETIAKMKAIANSPEGKAARSRGSKNRILTSETRLRLSEASKRKRHNEETRKRLSEIAKNRSPELRAKIGNGRRGKKHSEETRRKMSESRKNPTPEQRKKMSDFQKARWAKWREEHEK